jgi:PAS domain S-box-containing protein
MLEQVRTLFLTLCLIWTLVGLVWADLDGVGGPYVTVGAVAAVVVPLVVGYRRGRFPRWTWLVEGVGVCVVATGSGHAVTFGLLFVWVNFRALYGSLTDQLIGGGTIFGIMAAGAVFWHLPVSDAFSMLVAASLGLIVNHVLARGIHGRDRAAVRERAVARAGAEFAATTSRSDATAVAVKTALTMDPDVNATLIAIVAGGNARIIGAAGEVEPEVAGRIASIDQLGNDVRAALVPNGFALVSGPAAARFARAFQLPPTAAVAVAPLAVHDDVFGMIVLLTRRPTDDLRASLTTLADAAALTLDQQLSRSRLKIVVEHSPDALILASERGIIRFVNPAAEKLLDRPAAGLLGSDLYLLLNPQDLAATLATPSAEARTCRIRGREDQAWTETEAMVEYFTEHDGSRSIIFNARDVSERRRLERELQHAQKVQSVGRLAAGIAHEINTPIQFIGDNVRFIEEAFAGFVKILDAYEQKLRTTEPDDTITTVIEEADFEYLREETPIAIRQCLEGITQVAHIVRAMRAFGHPGGEPKKPADLNEAIRSTIVVAANEIKLVADVTTDLAELPMVPCRIGDINQTVLNLIINAAHAIKSADRGRGTIHITTRLEPDHAVIEVADTGTGVPAEIADKLFDPFFTTKEVGSGTGQGLALVRTLVVDRHGGEIGFTSEPGVGTTFCVRLPLQDAAAPHRDEDTMEAAA